MELTITLRDNGYAAQIIDDTAEAEHLSREEAAVRLLESLSLVRRGAQSLITHIPSADRSAAVEAGRGFAQGHDWIVADFNADKQADIERENTRDFL